MSAIVNLTELDKNQLSKSIITSFNGNYHNDIIYPERITF